MFCEEQGVSREAERDGLDDEAVHVVALDGGAVIGTCRLRFENGDCRLERMAIEEDFRGRGIGAELLSTAETEARARGAGQMILHGQLRARTFYEGAAYAALSEDVFVEEGIEHVRMRKPL